MHLILLHLVLISSLLTVSSAAKILIIPGNVNSHGLFFATLGQGLAKLGHKINIVTPANSKVPRNIASQNLTLTFYKVDGETPFANSEEASVALTNSTLSDSFIEQFQIMYHFGNKLLSAWENDCVHLLENKKLMEEIDKERFDFAIIDPLSINCYYVLPYSLDIPYASMSLAFASWFFKIPRLPSFVSGLSYTDRMTLTQRLTSFVKDVAELSLINTTKIYAEKYAPNKPPLDLIELYERSSLFLFLDELSTGYPVPQMPNTVPVGDIMAQPAKPLPEDLKTFLDNSPDGAIIVSFGSFFDHIPEFIVKKFCDAFRRSQHRVVWKLKSAEFCTGLSNVRIMPWIPQNDLLAHHKVRLFITHGGLNSLIEAVYHSKPVIVFPLALDQPTNAAAAEYKGFGIHMRLSNFSTEDLEESIQKILTDKRFQTKAKFASAILKDKRDSPAERVSYMINHVMKYGDAHLRTGAYHLTPFQFVLFDVYLVITGLVLVVCFVFVLVAYCVCKAFKKCLFRRDKIKKA